MTPAYDAAGAASRIEGRSILTVLNGAIKQLWEKIAALVRRQNARIKQLEDEVAALRAAAGSCGRWTGRARRPIHGQRR